MGEGVLFMKKPVWDWKVVLGIVLVLLSAIAYFIHYLLFHDAHHIFIYLLGDIGFVFFEVSQAFYQTYTPIASAIHIILALAGLITFIISLIYILKN